MTDTSSAAAPVERRRAPYCRATIDGPKVGYRVVAWRKRCGKRTNDPSGLCHVHRDDGWYIGKRRDER